MQELNAFEINMVSGGVNDPIDFGLTLTTLIATATATFCGATAGFAKVRIAQGVNPVGWRRVESIVGVAGFACAGVATVTSGILTYEAAKK